VIIIHLDNENFSMGASMGQFTCSKCGHTQAAEDTLIGRKVKCPACHEPGVVTASTVAAVPTTQAAVASVDDADPIVRRYRWLPRIPQLNRTLPAVAILLLTASVCLQGLILWRVWEPESDERVRTVRIQPEESIPVDVTRSCEIEVTVENASYEPIPISLERNGLISPLSVSLDGIGTTEELNVNLQNHYILSGDPIPVEIEP
jgi:hypothetical protein